MSIKTILILLSLTITLLKSNAQKIDEEIKMPWQERAEFNSNNFLKFRQELDSQDYLDTLYKYRDLAIEHRKDSLAFALWNRITWMYYSPIRDTDATIKSCDSLVSFTNEYFGESSFYHMHISAAKSAAYMNKRSYAKALKIVQKAIAKSESNTLIGPEAKILSQRGGMYLNAASVAKDLGDFQLAIHYSEMAQKLESNPSPYTQVKTATALAENYFNLNNFDKAISLLENKNSLIPQVSSYEAKASFYFAQAEIWMELEKYDKVESAWEKALENWMALKKPNFRNINITFANLIELHITTKDFARAENMLQRAKLWNGKENLDSVGLILLSIPKATLSLEKNNFDEVISVIEGTYDDLFLKVQNINQYGNPEISNHVGKPRRAIDYFRYKAEALKGKYAENLDTFLLKTLIDTYAKIDTLAMAVRENTVNSQSKLANINDHAWIYENATKAQLDMYQLTSDQDDLNKAYNYTSKNKAIVLIDALNNQMAIDELLSEVDQNKYEELVNHKIDLQKNIRNIKGEKKSTNEINQLKDSLSEIELEYLKLINNFKEKYPKYHNAKHTNKEAYTIEKIQDRLDPDQLVVEYFFGENNLFSFAISQKEVRVYRDSLDESLINSLTYFRAMIQGDSLLTEKGFAETSYALFESFLDKPLKDFGNEIKRLTIIPDGRLQQISFESLLMKDYVITNWNDPNIPYLLKDYSVSYAYSNLLMFDDYQPSQLRKAEKAFIGFALEEYDYSKATISPDRVMLIDSLTMKRYEGRLPYSVPEVEEIADLMNGLGVYNKEATKQKFFDLAPTSKIVHLATHGVSEIDDPDNSAIFFAKNDENSDHLLRANEVYQLNLNADLTVLNACQTGYGKIEKGEGIRSLARAFYFAGSPSLVASLWTIPDYSSKEIIVNFYKNLLNGSEKDIALQQAKLEYLKNASNNMALPTFWSQTILIGDTKSIVNISYSKVGLLGIVALGLLFIAFFFFRKNGINQTHG